MMIHTRLSGMGLSQLAYIYAYTDTCIRGRSTIDSFPAAVPTETQGLTALGSNMEKWEVETGVTACIRNLHKPAFHQVPM